MLQIKVASKCENMHVRIHIRSESLIKYGQAAFG